MKGIEARLNKPKFNGGRAANVTDLRLTKRRKRSDKVKV